METPTPAAAAAIADAPPPAGVTTDQKPDVATPPAAPAPASAASQAPAEPDPDASANLLSEPPPDAAKPIAPIAPDPLIAPPSPEAVAAITAAIVPADLGKSPDGTPIPWDQAAVGRVAEVFARHGVKPEVANEIVQAYAQHAAKSYAAAAEADAQQNKAMVSECRAKFGADMPRYIAEARKGGADIFGKELFSQLASVPAFANDHRILSALAARGRAVTDDPGPGGPGAPEPALDLATGMYGDELKKFK